MIKLTDWIAAIPPIDKTIAYVGENESVTRQFFLPDLTYRDYAFYLDMAFDLSTVTTEAPPRTIQSTQQSTTETVNADGTTVTATANTSKESYTDETVTVDCSAETDIAPLAKLVREDGLLLTWSVLSQQTQLPGPLRATLRAVGPNGEIKKSAMMVFFVAPSVAADPASPISLSEHEQMEKAMALALEQAADETYAAFEAKMEGETGEIKAYIDEKTALAQGDAKAYTDEKTALAQATANAYTDEKTALAHDDAKAYTDEKTALAEEDAKAYTDEKTALAQAAANAYTDEKTAPAGEGVLGTVMLDAYNKWHQTGLGINSYGLLQLMPASHLTIDNRTGHAPICPKTLDYAVKSVGDGYYALADDLPKEKVYEEIATITVAADEDGSLPEHVIFSADSEGNAFELTDFIVKAYAGFTDGNKSTLYMKLNGIGSSVINNGSINSISSSLRGFLIYFQTDNAGCKRIEYTASGSNDALYNPMLAIQASRLIPPMSDLAYPQIAKIDLYTLVGDNKTWVEGSTFTLYGVRK